MLQLRFRFKNIREPFRFFPSHLSHLRLLELLHRLISEEMLGDVPLAQVQLRYDNLAVLHLMVHLCVLRVVRGGLGISLHDDVTDVISEHTLIWSHF